VRESGKVLVTSDCLTEYDEALFLVSQEMGRKTGIFELGTTIPVDNHDEVDVLEEDNKKWSSGGCAQREFVAFLVAANTNRAPIIFAICPLLQAASYEPHYSQGTNELQYRPQESFVVLLLLYRV